MNPTESRKYIQSIKKANYLKDLQEHDLCKIDSCKFFENCNKIQIPGNKVKCVKYIHKLH
jgi:hypothetical protein